MSPSICAGAQRLTLMQRKRIFLDDENTDIFSYHLYNRGASNRPERERMRRILMRAIRHGMTDRQRDCMMMYYLEGCKMQDIADVLGLSRSTVSRHIAAATLKLRKVASYYEK